MRDELTSAGVHELRTPAEVDAFLAASEGTALLVVNSVCGCAAGAARPAVRIALSAEGPKPDRVASVFAGVDVEATKRARELFGASIAPSSPCFAFFRDGRLSHFIPRWQIEGSDAAGVASKLGSLFAGEPVSAGASAPGLPVR
jgi:putative YphP/YqiW family bacilliredoxin